MKSFDIFALYKQTLSFIDNYLFLCYTHRGKKLEKWEKLEILVR